MRGKEQQQCEEAARSLLKMTMLHDAIRSGRGASDLWKPLLYLKWNDEGKAGYVFDPEKVGGVCIGRDPSLNDICIHREEVSKTHCRFFYNGGILYLQDLNSMNGTWYKKGFRWKQINNYIDIAKKTRIRVGDLVITAELFYYSYSNI